MTHASKRRASSYYSVNSLQTAGGRAGGLAGRRVEGCVGRSRAEWVAQGLGGMRTACERPAGGLEGGRVEGWAGRGLSGRVEDWAEWYPSNGDSSRGAPFPPFCLSLVLSHR